ncbi:hypothetical protein FVE85_2121 [Porphyridium purpureum]|uniref:Uncharacterized protein n=1 Tax=Porphyridium purpureum TaxID=35688 RepID=A0A5J4YX91_PORPP|nr:hypothetical protein FVE85_2121 [Porphyridium purpureum]|eukprot:POR6596..scf209_3
MPVHTCVSASLCAQGGADYTRPVIATSLASSLRCVDVLCRCSKSVRGPVCVCIGLEVRETGATSCDGSAMEERSIIIEELASARDRIEIERFCLAGDAWQYYRTLSARPPPTKRQRTSGLNYSQLHHAGQNDHVLAPRPSRFVDVDMQAARVDGSHRFTASEAPEVLSRVQEQMQQLRSHLMWSPEPFVQDWNSVETFLSLCSDAAVRHSGFGLMPASEARCLEILAQVGIQCALQALRKMDEFKGDRNTERVCPASTQVDRTVTLLHEAIENSLKIGERVSWTDNLIALFNAGLAEYGRFFDKIHAAYFLGMEISVRDLVMFYFQHHKQRQTYGGLRDAGHMRAAEVPAKSIGPPSLLRNVLIPKGRSVLEYERALPKYFVGLYSEEHVLDCVHALAVSNGDGFSAGAVCTRLLAKLQEQRATRSEKARLAEDMDRF